MTLEELNTIEAGEDTFRAKTIARYTELFESMSDEKLERRVQNTPPITAELTNNYISTSILILEKQAAHLSKMVIDDKFKKLMIETAYYTEMLGQLFPDIEELTNPQYGVAAVRQALDITHEAQEKLVSICYPELKGPKAAETPTAKTNEFHKDVSKVKFSTWDLNEKKYTNMSDEDIRRSINDVPPVKPGELIMHVSLSVKKIERYAKQISRDFGPDDLKKTLITSTYYATRIQNTIPENMDRGNTESDLQLIVDEVDNIVTTAMAELHNIWYQQKEKDVLN